MIPTVVLPTTEIIEAKKLILREHDYFSLFNSLNSLHLVIVLTIKLILDIIVVFNWSIVIFLKDMSWIAISCGIALLKQI